MKIGLLGGSFDPVHNGHLALASAALATGMDRVILIPAAQAPLKPALAQAPAADRLAMLNLAIEGRQRLSISDIEIRRGGLNYSIDTVRALRAGQPPAEWFWIIGADQLAKLPRWHAIDALTREIRFLCAARPGHALQAPAGLPALRWQSLECPAWDLSSTDIRRKIANGDPLDGLVPNKVIEYLREKRLYR